MKKVAIVLCAFSLFAGTLSAAQPAAQPDDREVAKERVPVEGREEQPREANPEGPNTILYEEIQQRKREITAKFVRDMEEFFKDDK